MIGAAISFLLLALLPIDFAYPVFALILFLNGVSMGMFASPNRAGVMNSLPPGDRGAGGGMNQTFQNSAQVLSVGIFFTLMILGLSATLPHTMASGLEAHGVSASGRRARRQPAAGVDPVRGVPRLQPDPAPARLHGRSATCRAHTQAVLTGRSFFPQLISEPFRNGLHEAFAFAIVACLIAAVASWSRRTAVCRRRGSERRGGPGATGPAIAHAPACRRAPRPRPRPPAGRPAIRIRAGS